MVGGATSSELSGVLNSCRTAAFINFLLFLGEALRTLPKKSGLRETLTDGWHAEKLYGAPHSLGEFVRTG